MHSPLPLRRLLLGAALTTTALVAVPSVAGAASTCTGPDVLGQVRINDGSGSLPLRIFRSDVFIGYADGSGATRFCSGPNGFAAITNTNQIVVDGHPAHASDSFQVSNRGGALAPGPAVESDGINEIEVLILTGTAHAELLVEGTEGDDSMRVTSGGGVMIGDDPDVDVRLKTATRVSVFGWGGSDFISARGDTASGRAGSSVPVNLQGIGGRDTLVDGLAKGDLIVGSSGDDTLFTSDGRADDVNGSTGFDSLTGDSVDRVSQVEQAFGGAPVGRLKLTPRIITAARPRMKLSWTHPKAWKQLRRIAVRVYDGSELVQRIVVRPRHASHRGRTVSADLKLRIPKRLAGHNLRIDVEATDRRGRRQFEPAAGLVTP
jgi:hypothetical protein